MKIIDKILGKKMIAPMMVLHIAAQSTAAAAMSLIFFMCG
jgi:hypothetical protein